jgi:site-specific DNA recombinase
MSGADNCRPQYQSMLAAAARGEIDVLLLDDLSRLSRDQVESEQVIRRLQFHGVRIIAVSDGYDSRTKTATRKIQRGVKNLINEMRLDELREQVHRGLTGPYGYRLTPILDTSQRDAYGNPSRIGTVLEIETRKLTSSERCSKASLGAFRTLRSHARLTSARFQVRALRGSGG